MRLAHKRHHVMFTVAVNLDVLEEHELVVSLDLAEGALQRLVRIRAISPKVFVHRLHDARWRVEQTLARGIFADEAQEGTDVVHRLF